MTTARDLLQEALTYSNAWLTALEADGEDEAAASQAELNERITSFLAQPEPEPVAQVPYAVWRKGFDAVREWKEAAKPEPSVELVAALNAAAIDYAQCWKGGEPDEAAFRDLGFGRGKLFGLAADALERLVRERDEARDDRDVFDNGMKLNHAGMVKAEQRAEAAERDAKRYRWIRAHHHIANDNPRNWAFVTESRSGNIDAAIDAAIAQEAKP